MKSYFFKFIRKVFGKVGILIFQSSNKSIVIGNKANFDIEFLKVGEKLNLLDSKTTDSQLKNWLLSKIIYTNSQYFQDLIILFLLDQKKNGYFVEFGACDGIELSNTLLLERDYKWSGILSEPLKDFHEKLAVNRECKLDQRAVWPVSNISVYLENFGPLGLSKFSEKSKFLKLNHPRFQAVKTVSLNDLLLSHGAPVEIDFVSMDTEGSEFEILNTFPFKNWKIKIFCIEHNFSEKRMQIRELMEKNNYTFKEFGCDPIDDWYILKA
jgi:FkbM family methyltransferase